MTHPDLKVRPDTRLILLRLYIHFLDVVIQALPVLFFAFLYGASQLILFFIQKFHS